MADYARGARVVLIGLSKEVLNGTVGRVLETPADAAPGRLRIRYLHPTSGEITISAIKPVNLREATDDDAAPSDDPAVVDAATAMVQQMIGMVTAVFEANEGRAPTEDEVRALLADLTPERIEEMMTTAADPELAAAFTGAPPAEAPAATAVTGTAEATAESALSPRRRAAVRFVASAVAVAVRRRAAATATAHGGFATKSALSPAESDVVFGWSGVAVEERNLWVLASDGELEAVQALLARDPTLDANSFDENGYSPMHAAATYGRMELLLWLLANGGEAGLRDSDGDTPLHVAESVAAARVLLAHGADVLAANVAGECPRDKAIEDENDELAEFLLLQAAL